MLELFDSAVIDINVLSVAIAFAIIAMYLLMIQIIVHLSTEGNNCQCILWNHEYLGRGRVVVPSCCVGSEELLPNPKMGITYGLKSNNIS